MKPDGQIRDLWTVQSEVLSKYYGEMLEDSRVAFELPTGAGKSIIALLILEMWIKAGKRVAILVSSLELSKDMVRRCRDIGIPCAMITGRRDDEEERRIRFRNIKNYQRRQAIGIMNYLA